MLESSRPVRIPPLAFWLACQFITLAIGAARVPLIARAGDLPQRFALPEMIVVQLAIASMSFPWLLAAGNRTMTIVASILFLHLAAMLTATPPAAEGWTVCAITLWLVVLSGTEHQRHISVAVAIATTIFCGTPILQYLIEDFGESATSRILVWANPLGSIVQQSTAVRCDIRTLALASCFAIAKLFFAWRSPSSQRA